MKEDRKIEFCFVEIRIFWTLEQEIASSSVDLCFYTDSYESLFYAYEVWYA